MAARSVRKRIEKCVIFHAYFLVSSLCGYSLWFESLLYFVSKGSHVFPYVFREEANLAKVKESMIWSWLWNTFVKNMRTRQLNRQSKQCWDLQSKFKFIMSSFPTLSSSTVCAVLLTQLFNHIVMPKLCKFQSRRCSFWLYTLTSVNNCWLINILWFECCPFQSSLYFHDPSVIL